MKKTKRPFSQIGYALRNAGSNVRVQPGKRAYSKSTMVGRKRRAALLPHAKAAFKQRRSWRQA